MKSNVVLGGALTARKIGGERAPLSWRVRNGLRIGYWWGWLAHVVGGLYSRLFGAPVLLGKLSAVLVRADGSTLNYGVLGWRVVTTAYVTLLVDELQGSQAAHSTFAYHDSGTGTGSEAAGDTGLGTKVETGRATGTQTEGAAANIYRSVGTISYTATRAITEQGLFSASSGGTLMDRSVFTAINVVDGDSIQFTYEMTATAGG
jgi:hypothetical protein